MSLKYIRNEYKVPAKRGTKVKFRGVEHTITSANGPYLRAKGPNGIITIHPTWEVEYL